MNRPATSGHCHLEEMVAGFLFFRTVFRNTYDIGMRLVVPFPVRGVLNR